MLQFQFIARNGARLFAEYEIADGKLHVAYRGISMSVTAGVNEIANAFLRDNLMRTITGEIDVLPLVDAGVARAPVSGRGA